MNKLVEQQVILGFFKPSLLIAGLGVSFPSHAASLAVLTNLNYFAGSYAEMTGLLAQGRDGLLYGTANSGGAYGYGTAFKLTPEGAFTKLHDFDYVTDGGVPYGGLTLGADGDFYGTTSTGGAGAGGTAFKMTPTGTVTVLHHFGSVQPDGCKSLAPPIQARDGNLYGTTERCGAHSLGSVYRITQAGDFSLLYSFTWGTRTAPTPLGAYPDAPLIQGRDGVLYGSAPSGGLNRRGTLFKITTDGKVSVLYTFDSMHGNGPYAPVIQGADGSLYGTTMGGGTALCGVVFKVTLGGLNSVLHNFDCATDGGHYPYAGLVSGSDGNFYGAASSGGTSGHGVLFRVTPTGAYSVEANFDGANGSAPSPTPFLHTNGKIYGMTKTGGTSGEGTIYSLDVGAPSFISPIPSAAEPGASIGLLGAVIGTTRVTFNGVSAPFSGSGGVYRKAVVPTGAATGLVKVTTSGGTLQTLKPFLQLPILTAFGPASGAVGSSVVLTGTGLTQTTKVKFSGGKGATFVVNTDSQITVTVPVGATNGKISLTTQGGTVSTVTAFTVTP